MKSGIVKKEDKRHFKWIYLIKKLNIYEGLLNYQNRYACISLNPKSQEFQPNFINNLVKKTGVDFPCFPGNNSSRLKKESLKFNTSNFAGSLSRLSKPEDDYAKYLTTNFFNKKRSNIANDSILSLSISYILQIYYLTI